MSWTASRPAALAADVQALGGLKFDAARQDPQTVRQAAKEFESLFMREVIKSMRQATMRSGMLDSQAGDMSQDLYDQQLAQSLTGLPGGLSDAIVRQLTQQMSPSQAAQAPTSPGAQAVVPTAKLQAARSASAAAGASTQVPATGPSGFVQKHQRVAQEVARASGIPASFMLGQAGLETGWGRHEIRHRDGSTSHNLFGIKAGPDWQGKVAEVTTTEYVQGQPVKTVAKFRAYDSYRESFADYVKLMSGSQRYAHVMNNTHDAQAYAQTVQRSGYATDPQYANKLSRAIQMSTRAMAVQV